MGKFLLSVLITLAMISYTVGGAVLGYLGQSKLIPMWVVWAYFSPLFALGVLAISVAVYMTLGDD